MRTLNKKEVSINMKKRVLLIVAAMSLLVAVGLTGCGGTTVEDPNAVSNTSSAPVSSMAMSDVTEDNLNGLLTYLKGNGAINGETKEMKPEMIGAVDGKMIQVIYGDQTALAEIYEFDKNNLNDQANQVLENARNNGKFTSMDGELTAVLSNNEKYLLIYKDVYTDETNGPIQQRFVTLFKEFDPTSAASSETNGTESSVESDTTESQANDASSATESVAE